MAEKGASYTSPTLKDRFTRYARWNVVGLALMAPAGLHAQFSLKGSEEGELGAKCFAKKFGNTASSGVKLTEAFLGAAPVKSAMDTIFGEKVSAELAPIPRKTAEFFTTNRDHPNGYKGNETCTAAEEKPYDNFKYTMGAGFLGLALCGIGVGRAIFTGKIRRP